MPKGPNITQLSQPPTTKPFATMFLLFFNKLIPNKRIKICLS